MSPDLVQIGSRDLTVIVAPEQGGRIAQISALGTDLLIGPAASDDVSGWGAFPMTPWCGRIRHGRFDFDGDDHQLPINAPGGHAIHGFGYTSAWTLDASSDTSVSLTLALPHDASWPFGGVASQRFTVDGPMLRLDQQVNAGPQAMPAECGWHPWFRTPSRFEFAPTAMYRRDHESITVAELVDVAPEPWDDCFINTEPVRLQIGAVWVTITSGLTDWVIFNELPHATCVEPQTAPPDAFNLAPRRLEPGQSRSAAMTIEVAPA